MNLPWETPFMLQCHGKQLMMDPGTVDGYFDRFPKPGISDDRLNKKKS